jgi:hypothetical protein
MEVDQNHMGLQGADALDPFQTIASLSNHFKIIVALQQGFDPAAKQSMVINQ